MSDQKSDDGRQHPPSVHIDGWCPFLTCTEDGPHDHAVCPDCGAVRYGNLFCPTCVAVLNAERAAHGFTDPIPVFQACPTEGEGARDEP